MEYIRYFLINKETLRIASLIDVPIGEGMTWNYPTDDYFMVASDFDCDFNHDYNDYRYDPDSGEIILDPPENSIEYTDLESGTTVTMTQEDLDALIDEKTRNNVEAVMQQMIEDGTFLIPVASSTADVINEFGDQNDG